MTAKVPLIACVAVLAFFAGITGVHLAYTLAYVLVLLLVGAFIWSRALRRRIRVTRTSPQGTYMVGEPFAETFTAENLRAIRPGYGLPPKYLPEVLGRRASQALARGTRLNWDAIE